MKTTSLRVGLFAGGLLALCCALSACEKSPQPATAERVAAPVPGDAPSIRVHPEESGFIFRYFPAGERTAKAVMSLSAVPEDARHPVIVVPTELEVPAGLVYVADLREAGEDGTYPYDVLLATELDRRIEQERGPAPSTITTQPVMAGEPGAAMAAAAASAGPAASAEIVMYSTTWCGVCTQARRWLDNKGYAYEERDVERDAGARDEMVARAQSVGFPSSQLNGVPIFWVNGQMLSGFNPRAIDNLL